MVNFLFELDEMLVSKNFVISSIVLIDNYQSNTLWSNT